MILQLFFYLSFYLTGALSPSLLIAEPNSFTVIVHQSNEKDQISKNELQQIYMGSMLYWTSGDRIQPAYTENSNGSSFFYGFLENIVGSNKDHFKKFWRRRLFSGRGIPPRRFKGTEDVIDYIPKPVDDTKLKHILKKL